MEELLKEINEKLDFISLNNQEIFTTEEACEYLRIGRNKFDDAVKNGDIRFKLNGRNKLFKKIWLDNWMEI